MSVFSITLILLVVAAGYAVATLLLLRRCRLPEPVAESFEVELPTVGHHVRLFRYVPDTPRFQEPVVLCHGLGANRFNLDFTDDGTGSDRLSLARALQRAGFDVWLLELRGRGRARVPPGADWTADDEVEEDVPAAIETVLDLTGAERIYWVGHSWGGILQYLLHARRHRDAERVAGLVTIASPATLRFQRAGRWLFHAPGLFLARLGLRVPLRLLGKLGLVFSWPIRWLGGLFLADLHAMDGPVLRRVFASLVDDINPGVVRQGLGWLSTGDFSNLDGVVDDFAHYDKPLLLMVGSHDRICPVASLSHLKDRVVSDDVTLRVLGTATGFSSDYGHGTILIGRHAPDEVFPLIRGWLAARATRLSRVGPRPSGTNGSTRKNGRW